MNLIPEISGSDDKDKVEQRFKILFQETLCRAFGPTATFRAYQLEAMESVAKGNDTLTVLPTGTGKSLIYGLPPAALGVGHVSVVVCPLLALGKNQATSLIDELDVDARVYTTSTSTPEQQKRMAADLADPEGSIQVLITTPETLSGNQMLRDALSVASSLDKVFCIAIDEAHVAEPWGREFRPAYRYIPESLQVLGRRPPLLACTASASPEAIMRIMDTLGMKKDTNVFVSSADRPEIQLSVVPKELLVDDVNNVNKVNEDPDRDPVVLKMAEFVKEGVSGLIFCRNKATVDRVAASLQSMEGLEDLVLPYHAGHPLLVRETNQRAWEEGDVSVLVCTIAFGMGINKPDVRFVLHYDPPADLGEYLQQIGRAGRDGQKACAVMFASHQEMEQGKRFRGFQGVYEYVYSGSCRRKVLSSEFGEERSCSGRDEEFKCDICRKTARLGEAMKKIDRLAAKSEAASAKRGQGEEPSARRSVLQKVENVPPSTLLQKPRRTSQNTGDALTAPFVNPWKRQTGGGEKR